MAIDHTSDRPVFAQIADALRQRIRSGAIAPGAKLPSESELVEEFGVTRTTARRGLAVLQQEGLTEARRGLGVFVRETAPVIAVRNNRFSRSARAAGKGALAAEAEALGLDWQSEEQGPVEIVDVPDEIAQAIGEPRAAVKRRRMWVGGVPTQLADSYIPASVDVEIGYSAGLTVPGGIYGLLEANGHRLDRFREELVARQASPEEAVALHLSNGAPVVSLVRHAIDEAGKVVEYFDSVAAADRHRYVYEFKATD
ncbi:GntR family transcriptional regulator [Pseudonocardia sp. ICBG1293]|uniref:GntR family transcriptional regulator n=2 Tax=Pseudonocardia sp. ICBG1293 TaxID=2844382 RepID=UPI001CCB90B6|nr:GntR family transcriptional regulator [Pseudonocardia sp. ICBG1293]